MRGKKLKKGFTLVELVIAIGIFAFVVGTSYSLMHSSTLFVNKGINNVNKQNDIRLAVEWITKDLKSSDKLTKFDTGSTLYSIEEKGNKVEYIREELGEIKGEKVYKIFRQDSKDKFVLIENIPDLGLKIESLENLFNVTITHKDKFNEDRVTNFKVSTKKNVALVEPPTPIIKTNTPTIDIPLFEGERTISGTAEPNSNITIKKGSNIIGTGVTDGSGHYIVTLNSPLVNKDVITVTALAPDKIESDPATAKVISGEDMLTASPIVLKESSSNDGSLENNIIKVVLNYGAGNFDNHIDKNDVIIDGLPKGMDFIVYRSSSKELTITLTGKAINHSDSNDVNITIIVKNTGFTGNSSHGKDGVSNPVFIDFMDKSKWEDVVVLTKRIKIDGSAAIEAPNSTVIIKDNILDSGKLANNIKILSDKIFINNNLYLTGSATIGNYNNTSSIYLNGNFKIDGGADVYGKLYYTGDFVVPSWWTKPINVTEVSSINFPITSIPSLEMDAWYAGRGFTSDRTARNGMKLLSSTSYSYNFPTWQSFENVNVVSKSNITLSGNVHVSGMLFAPNGKVTIEGSSTFTGIIVASEVELTGNVRVRFTPFNLGDLPFKN